MSEWIFNFPPWNYQKSRFSDDFRENESLLFHLNSLIIRSEISRRSQKHDAHKNSIYMIINAELRLL